MFAQQEAGASGRPSPPRDTSARCPEPILADLLLDDHFPRRFASCVFLPNVLGCPIKLSDQFELGPPEVHRADETLVIPETDLQSRCREPQLAHRHSTHRLARRSRVAIREIERPFELASTSRESELVRDTLDLRPGSEGLRIFYR